MRGRRSAFSLRTWYRMVLENNRVSLFSLYLSTRACLPTTTSSPAAAMPPIAAASDPPWLRSKSASPSVAVVVPGSTSSSLRFCSPSRQSSSRTCHKNNKSHAWNPKPHKRRKSRTRTRTTSLVGEDPRFLTVALESTQFGTCLEQEFFWPESMIQNASPSDQAFKTSWKSNLKQGTCWSSSLLSSSKEHLRISSASFFTLSRRSPRPSCIFRGNLGKNFAKGLAVSWLNCGAAAAAAATVLTVAPMAGAPWASSQ